MSFTLRGEINDDARQNGHRQIPSTRAKGLKSQLAEGAAGSPRPAAQAVGEPSASAAHRPT
jgi:hypothetical protein